MSHDRERAAAYVQVRRGQMGMTQADLAEAAEVDPKTINGLETGRSWPRPTTLAAIERVLRLEAGSLDAVARGGRAVVLDDSAGEHNVTDEADALLLDHLTDLDYLTDEDVTTLMHLWSDTRKTILNRAREINDTRRIRGGTRRRKGA